MKGINRLAQVLDTRTIKRTTAPSLTDFGTVGDGGTLKLDQFGPVIPRNGYLVSEWMVSGIDDTGHVPNLELRVSPTLQPGDRVIVLWVRDEPVIISKVGPADA